MLKGKEGLFGHWLCRGALICLEWEGNVPYAIVRVLN